MADYRGNFYRAGRADAQLASAHLFNVSISGLYNSNFIAVDGLGGEMTPFEYKEGGNNFATHCLPDHVKWTDITLTKGEVRDDADLWYWFRTYFQLEGGLPKPQYYRDVVIEAIDNDNVPIIRWRVYKAFVKSLLEGGFNSMTSAFRINTVVLGHHGVDVEYPNATLDRILDGTRRLS